MQRLGEGVLLWLAGPDHLIGRGKPGRTDLMGRRWKRITQPGNPKKREGEPILRLHCEPQLCHGLISARCVCTPCCGWRRKISRLLFFFNSACSCDYLCRGPCSSYFTHVWSVSTLRDNFLNKRDPRSQQTMCVRGSQGRHEHRAVCVVRLVGARTHNS